MRLLSWIDEVVESLELGPEANLAMTVSVTGGIVIGSRTSQEYAKLVRMFRLDSHCPDPGSGPCASLPLCSNGTPDGIKRRVLLLGALLRPLREMHRRQRWEYAKILSCESMMRKVLQIADEAVLEVAHSQGNEDRRSIDATNNNPLRKKLLHCVLSTDVPRPIAHKVVPSLEAALCHCTSVVQTHGGGSRSVPQLKPLLQVIPIRGILSSTSDLPHYFHPNCVYLSVLDRLGMPMSASPVDTENRVFAVLASVELGATWLRCEVADDDDDDGADPGGDRDSSDDCDESNGGGTGKGPYTVEGQVTPLLAEQEMLHQVELYFEQFERLGVRVLFSACQLPQSVVFVGQRYHLTILWIDQEDAERVEVAFGVRPITITGGGLGNLPSHHFGQYRKLFFYDGGKGLLLQKGDTPVSESPTASPAYPFGVVFAVDSTADSAASLARAIRKTLVACTGGSVTYVAGAGMLESAVVARLRSAYRTISAPPPTAGEVRQEDVSRRQRLEKVVLQCLEEGLLDCASLAMGGPDDVNGFILRESRFASAVGVGLNEEKMSCLDRAETLLEGIQVVFPIAARLCNLDDAAYR